MRTDPTLEGADLQLRAARFDYRQLSQQLARRRLFSDSAKQFEFAEQCFHAAEKTIRVRSQRGNVDEELGRLWGSVYRTRIAVLKQLSWLSNHLRLDPALKGADAVRLIYSMPNTRFSSVPGPQQRGTLDAFLIVAGFVILGLFLLH